jgi:hypothetical protein
MMITSRTTNPDHIVSAYTLADIERAAGLDSGSVRLEHDRSAPMPWAVWSGDEILGAGPSRKAALAEAAATVAGWAVSP